MGGAPTRVTLPLEITKGWACCGSTNRLKTWIHFVWNNATISAHSLGKTPQFQPGFSGFSRPFFSRPESSQSLPIRGWPITPRRSAAGRPEDRCRRTLGEKWGVRRVGWTKVGKLDDLISRTFPNTSEDIEDSSHLDVFGCLLFIVRLFLGYSEVKPSTLDFSEDMGCWWLGTTMNHSSTRTYQSLIFFFQSKRCQNETLS